MLVNIVALVFVLTEGQYVSADYQFSLMNVRQKVQNNGLRNRRAFGSFIQHKLEQNTSKRSQGQLKEEHNRGMPIFLSSLIMSSLDLEVARHNLIRHFGERRRMPCAPTCPLSR